MANGYAKMLDALVPKNDDLLRNIGSAITFGTIKSIEPLIINIENRMELDEGFFILSPFCKDYTIKVEQTYASIANSGHTHSSEHPISTENSHTHDTKITMSIKLWRGLKIGDIVNMIMSSDKQKYYIINYQNLEVGEITDDSANIQ